MYERIVLAYDGTREGLIAVREGALLAKHLKSKLFILSVVPDRRTVMTTETVHVDLMGSQIDTYQKLLDQAVRTAHQLGLDPVAKLVVGEPTPQIAAFATSVNADLIVLGHRKSNLLQRWWSGGGGSYISDIVNCSVLVGRKTISDEDFKAALKASAETPQV
jgi:nucleotide-binding universal stress UspA family protein